jgi:hypothetical protein
MAHGNEPSVWVLPYRLVIIHWAITFGLDVDGDAADALVQWLLHSATPYDGQLGTVGRSLTDTLLCLADRITDRPTARSLRNAAAAVVAALAEARLVDEPRGIRPREHDGEADGEPGCEGDGEKPGISSAETGGHCDPSGLEPQGKRPADGAPSKHDARGKRRMPRDPSGRGVRGERRPRSDASGQDACGMRPARRDQSERDASSRRTRRSDSDKDEISAEQPPRRDPSEQDASSAQARRCDPGEQCASAERPPRHDPTKQDISSERPPRRDLIYAAPVDVRLADGRRGVVWHPPFDGKVQAVLPTDRRCRGGAIPVPLDDLTQRSRIALAKAKVCRRVQVCVRCSRRSCPRMIPGCWLTERNTVETTDGDPICSLADLFSGRCSEHHRRD